MGLFSEVRVCIKNTFLEFLEDDVDDEVQPRILKAHTDSAIRSTALAKAAADPAAALAEPPAAPAAAPAGPQPRPPGELPTLLGGSQQPQSWTKPAAEEGSSRQLLKADDRPRAQRALAGEGAGREAEAPSAAASRRGGRGQTTVMLRNLPNDYTRSMLQDLLDTLGLAGKYDFLYLPVDLTRRAGLGYAFVNMVSAEDVRLALERLDGFRRWSVPSSKVCSVGWSVPCQGLEANIERFRSSPIMHSSVPDEFKPIVLVDGLRAAFPRPTKKVRKPDAEYQGRRRAQG